VQIDLVAVVVDEYDPAIAFFTGVLGFDLVEDAPSLTNDGRPKRWVVVRPPGAQTGLRLARADRERQAAAVANQAADRVGFFLRVDDFDAAHRRMTEAGLTFVRDLVPNRTAVSRSFSTSPVTGGIFSELPCQDDVTIRRAH
jgi:catechol 2,3-dioxygenase-like lactoylglutathione lyase family enzyme